MSDSSLELIGYQANIQNVESSLFLFNHLKQGCSTTISISACMFFDLYTGIRHPEIKALSPECPRYCLDEHNLGRCDAMCECAFVREIIQILKK